MSAQRMGLSIRAAAQEYGIGRERLKAMVERGDLNADTSRPGLTLIPRGELERAFRGAQAFDVEMLRREVRAAVAEALPGAIEAALGRLAARLAGDVR